jgi:CheY-like chemotaxis protein
VSPTVSHPSGQVAATILVVDDDEAMRDLLSRMLGRAGYAVETAADGCNALQRFHEHAIDAVVTDLSMPKMNGLELTRALLTERPELPIIAVTGVDASYLRVAIAAGAKAGMQKPIPPGALAQTVRRLLPQRA